MTIMYLAVVFLLAGLVVRGVARVRGLGFAHGGSPVDGAAILLVVALVIDLLAQLTIGTQGWLLTFRSKQETLWKIGMAAQGLAVIFLVLGIWRLFVAVGQLGADKRRPTDAAE
jgi:hypothetical protein